MLLLKFVMRQGLNRSQLTTVKVIEYVCYKCIHNMLLTSQWPAWADISNPKQGPMALMWPALPSAPGWTPYWTFSLTSPLCVCMSQALPAPCVRLTSMSVRVHPARMEQSVMIGPMASSVAVLKVGF